MCSYRPCSAIVRPLLFYFTLLFIRIIRLRLQLCQIYLILLLSSCRGLYMQSPSNISYITCYFLNSEFQRNIRCKSHCLISLERSLLNKPILIRCLGQWLSGCSLESCWCKLVRRSSDISSSCCLIITHPFRYILHCIPKGSLCSQTNCHCGAST